MGEREKEGAKEREREAEGLRKRERVGEREKERQRGREIKHMHTEWKKNREGQTHLGGDRLRRTGALGKGKKQKKQKNKKKTLVGRVGPATRVETLMCDGIMRVKID